MKNLKEGHKEAIDLAMREAAMILVPMLKSLQIDDATGGITDWKEVESYEITVRKVTGRKESDLPSKQILKPLCIDFCTYYKANKLNKDCKTPQDAFAMWYVWKDLENSNLDEKLKDWD